MPCILKVLFGWLAIIFISMNSIGFLVRGFFWQGKFNRMIASVPSERTKGFIQEFSRNNFFLHIVAVVQCVVYLYLLFHWWNWIVFLVGLILMLIYLPDLLHNIRTGEKLNKRNTTWHILSLTLILLTFPLLWWGLCGN